MIRHLFFSFLNFLTKMASKSWYWFSFWWWLISRFTDQNSLSLLLLCSIFKTASLLWGTSCLFFVLFCMYPVSNKLRSCPQVEMTGNVGKQIHNKLQSYNQIVYKSNVLVRLLCLCSWRVRVKLELDNISSVLMYSKQLPVDSDSWLYPYHFNLAVWLHQ